MNLDFPHTFEALGERLSICVTPDHKFGTDAFLLSDFASPRRKDWVCDLGTGCGIIPMLWFRRMEDAPHMAYGVDIQEKAIAQLTETVSRNHLEGRLTPVLADLKQLPPLLEPGRFDLVTCNPPYKIGGGGILSEWQSEKIARHETQCTLADVVSAASRLLKFGGRFCLCQRPERLCDVLTLLRQQDLEPKRVRFVQQRPGTAPWLFLCEGKKGSKPFLQVEPPLIIEGENGFSEELLKIYGKR